MLFLESAAFAIVLIYVLSRIVRHAETGQFIVKFVLVSVACWVTEETCIRFYGFYSYSPTWSLFLGHVPILVILIWPVLIHSSRDLVSQLLHKKPKLVPLSTGAMVFADALLIEPVAVNAGLWSWSEPGIFDVPPIGILGWGVFACFCTLFLDTENRPFSKKRGLFIMPLPVIGTHALLLGIWWGALRWINVEVPSGTVAGIAWALSIVLTVTVLRRGTGRYLKKKTLLLRVPAALFFLALLILNAYGAVMLVAYAFAFAPPYLVIMGQQYLRRD